LEIGSWRSLFISAEKPGTCLSCRRSLLPAFLSSGIAAAETQSILFCGAGSSDTRSIVCLSLRQAQSMMATAPGINCKSLVGAAVDLTGRASGAGIGHQASNWPHSQTIHRASDAPCPSHFFCRFSASCCLLLLFMSTQLGASSIIGGLVGQIRSRCCLFQRQRPRSVVRFSEELSYSAASCGP
jgi:hypothetical protein